MPDEILKENEQEILGDYVRMIRTIRPDIIVGFVFDGAGGGQHHQTSSRLTAEAFRAAAKDWREAQTRFEAAFGGKRAKALRALLHEVATNKEIGAAA